MCGPFLFIFITRLGLRSRFFFIPAHLVLKNEIQWNNIDDELFSRKMSTYLIFVLKLFLALCFVYFAGAFTSSLSAHHKPHS